ncbi:zinc finger Ran-binding domain-containing protein 2-like [Chironomus tepperi]|uniref:zinc finger Ran-binding domain-containing protein 2-like n=1 Tax=Chironomus tepperi TaxID=113505 RepID=UPI00391F0981
MSSSKSSKSSKPFHKNSGDWFCPDKSCNNLNFARRDSCNRCKKPREDPKKKGSAGIGSALAKSSKGLFSADDWACTKCGNINWARRNQCNICNAKKFLEEDERTGLGGGFNEREKVEYKQRISSDSDEYDEFGRKKKNKRKKTSSEMDLKRKSRRRDRSSSRSTSSSSSSSSSTQTSSSSSRSNSPKRRRTSRTRSRSRSRDDRTRKSSESYEHQRREKSREKSPSKSRSENESEEDEESGDEDLSKYNLFDDDIDIEALKANK